MEDKAQKLKVLAKIAKLLNSNGISWAVGGSLLLYFKNKTDHFHDIDLMVCEKDIDKLKALLLPLGVFAPPHPNGQYKTRYFLEVTIDAVEIDIMAGFVIVCEGKEYDCSFTKEQIAEYISLNGEQIPLQSLTDWRTYYALMGRTAKVKMIDT